MYFKVKLWEIVTHHSQTLHVFPVPAGDRKEALRKALTYCLRFSGTGEATVNLLDERVHFSAIGLSMQIESIKPTTPDAYFSDVLYDVVPDPAKVGA